jgi:hypothetical protein
VGRKSDDDASGGEASGDEGRAAGVRAAAGGPARFDYGRVWRLTAYALIAGAAALLSLRRFDAAFLVAGLGAAAWFLNVRTTLIRKHDLVKVGGRDWRPRREVETDEEKDVDE